MKSTLQGIALVAAAMLITSCDSSSGGGAASIGTTTPAPQVAVSGTAVKGIIDGGDVAVDDANGVRIATSRTVAGSYTMVFDEARVAAGIAEPITVTITGGTTLCDFDNPNGTGNDCRTGPGATDFVAFGEPYALESTFTLRGVIPMQTGDSSLTNRANISPASEVAVKKAIEKAAGAALTTALALEANLAVTGLIESLTGVDLGGVDITQINTANLNATGGSTATAAEVAVAAFASAIIAAQGANETLTQTIDRIAASVTVDADGNLAGKASDLAILTTALAQGLTTAGQVAPNDSITLAIQNATSTANQLAQLGDAVVTIPAADGEISQQTPLEAAITFTRQFVTTIATVVGEVAASTGAENFGGDANIGATEVFATELDQIRLAASDNTTKAFSALDTALKADAAAIDAGTKQSPVTNGADDQDGLLYVLTKNGDGDFTATGVESNWPIDPMGANRVTVSAATATSSNPVSDAELFSIPNMTMVVKNGDTTLGTFTGDATAVAGTAAGTRDVTLNTSVVGATAGTSYDIIITLDELISNEQGDQGDYTAEVQFNSDSAKNLSVKFFGTIRNAMQSFTITTDGNNVVNGSVTRNGNTDTDVLTNGTVSLTLTLVDANVVTIEAPQDAPGCVGSGTPIGVYTTGAGETLVIAATQCSDGSVSYADGTLQSLPAIIF